MPLLMFVAVLAILAGWERTRPDLASAVAYFRERRAQLDYPAFRAAGWPTGSGATESAHQQIMQARMKRAGMRWARSHVNPLLALSLLEHNDRWASEGPSLLRQRRCSGLAQHRSRQQARRRDRAARHAHQVAAGPETRPAAAAAPDPPPAPAPRLARLPASTAGHRWRRYGEAHLERAYLTLAHLERAGGEGERPTQETRPCR